MQHGAYNTQKRLGSGSRHLLHLLRVWGWGWEDLMIYDLLLSLEKGGNAFVRDRVWHVACCTVDTVMFCVSSLFLFNFLYLYM